MKKALVLSLALLLGLSAASFAQTLTGSWDTKVTITPSPIKLEIDSTLVVTYTVSGWHFKSTSVLDETGWQDQVFTADGALGAFTLKSTLDFDPSPTPAFDSWVVEGGLSLAGVTFKATFTLAAGSTQLAITGDGTAGNVHINVALNLGDAVTGCDFDFNNVVIKVDFPFCCATVYSELKISCTGFDYAKFTVKGIVIPNLPWVTIDAEMAFTGLSSKTLTLTPSFNWGSYLCADFKLYIAQDKTGNLTLGNFYFDGIGLSCTIGGVKFEELSFWGEHATKPTVLGSYWEMFKISSSADGCCGGKFGFDLSVFFDHGAQLFDVAKIVANVSVNVTSNFVFKSGITLDLASSPAFTQWTIQFVVTW